MQTDQGLITQARATAKTLKGPAVDAADELIKRYEQACALSRNRIPERAAVWEQHAGDLRLDLVHLINFGQLPKKYTPTQTAEWKDNYQNS